MSDWESDTKPGWGSPESSSAKGSGEESRSDRKLIEKLLMSQQAEQRKSRRWGIFFKLLTFTYLFALLFLLWPFGDGLPVSAEEHTALVQIEGPIASDTDASADRIVGAIREAFENPAAKALILRINSPGGSPVQSGYINDEIERLRGEYPEKKVYAVIADIGASGAYYIAVAANEIYADKASLVGSIGVVSGSFGFTGLMDKLGIDRRLYTAGENKSFLDPFSPEEEEEVNFWEQVLANTHDQFIQQVREGRGDRLADNPELFSGLIWTGEQSVELGLVDGLGSASYVAREIVGQEEMVDYTRRPPALEQLMERFGVAVGGAVADQVIQSRLELR